jgi:hypothetical protein
MEVVNLAEAFSRFTDHWSPKMNHRREHAQHGQRRQRADGRDP